jgi:NADPH-dependent 2,4-dienoyl-CoA reductase/sulfur reductase-like enzyme
MSVRRRPTIIADMGHRIVILGVGTGGTLTANRLRRIYGDAAEITVVDRDDRHVYQPGLLFVPFGLADPAEIVRPRHAQIRDGIEFKLTEVDRVETAKNAVHLAGGETLECCGEDRDRDDREDAKGRAEAVEAAVGIVDREGERVVVASARRHPIARRRCGHLP